MVEFIQSAEQFVNANESVVFVNNTDSNFEVGTGIIFRKSGLYEVSVVGNRITVTKVSDLIKVGKWKRVSMDKYVQHAMAYYRCSECGKDIIGTHNYCPSCGAKMDVPDICVGKTSEIPTGAEEDKE